VTWIGATLSLVALPLFLAPSFRLAHRRLGTLVAVAGIAALAGGMRAEDRERVLCEPGLPAEPGRSEIEGWVREVRTGSWGAADTDWARLEVEIVDALPREGPLHGGDRLRLSVGRAARAWEIGDGLRVKVAPRLARGFCNAGRDSFARWLHRRGVRWTAWIADDRLLEPTAAPPGARRGLARLRGRIGAAIDGGAPAGSAAILRALVIGDRSDLSRTANEAFTRSGTAHLLSVSGLHLALVWGAGFALARRVVARAPGLARAAGWLAVPRLAAPVAFLPAAAYAALTGGEVATLRSLVMAAAFLGGTVLQRRARPLIGLVAAGGVLAWLDPDSLGDASFQLSFASVGAILLGVAAIERSGWREWFAPGRSRSIARRALGWTLSSIAVSVVASLATAPLTAHHFGLVSLVSVPANLVVGPVLGAGALGIGLLGALALALAEPLASLLFAAAGGLVLASAWMVERIAAWPWAAVRVSPPPLPLALAILVALAVPVLPDRPERRAVLAFAFLLAMLGLAWRPPPFRVSFLDVGQGDAAIVEIGPAHRAFVVDAGGLGGSFDTGAGVVVPALRDRRTRRLEAIVLSHAQRDHYGGLVEVAKQVGAADLWWNGRGSTASGFRALHDAVRESGARARTLDAGTPLRLDTEFAGIEVVHPPASSAALSMNDASLVLGVRYGALRVLFTGDVEKAGERAMVASGKDLGASVLKVPHHGSRTSSSHALLRAVRPALAVASLGHRNRFGFPAREVVERHRDLGSEWRDTGSAGEIVVESDGQLAEIESCRDVDAARAADPRSALPTKLHARAPQ